jgi:hypothetical protein
VEEIIEKGTIMDDFLKKMFIDEAKPALNRHSGNGGTGSGGSDEFIMDASNATTVISWDGNMEGKDTIDVSAIAGVEAYYVKVADIIDADDLTENDIIYQNYRFEQNRPIEEVVPGALIGIGSTMSWEILYILNKDIAEQVFASQGLPLSIPSNGVYFQYSTSHLGWSPQHLVIGHAKYSGWAPFFGKYITDLFIPERCDHIERYNYCNQDCMKTVTIPRSIKRVMAYAFYNCQGITSVTFEDGVLETVDDHAFFTCSNLDTVIFKNPTPPFFDGPYPFCASYNLMSIKVPAESVNAYKTALSGKTIGNTFGDMGDHDRQDVLLSDLVVADDSE